MRAEYDFSKGVRGKHAAQYASGTNVVVIDLDVAAEYPTAEEVNETLRAVAQFIKHRGKTRRWDQVHFAQQGSVARVGSQGIANRKDRTWSIPHLTLHGPIRCPIL
jgi:hypothetical protein